MALIDGVAASLVLPVEIRLALEKAMQVELLTGFAPCPRATVNETSSPVGRRHRETVYSDDVAVLVFLRVVPNVLVGLGVVSTLCSAVCTATSTRGQRIRRLVCRPTLCSLRFGLVSSILGGLKYLLLQCALTMPAMIVPFSSPSSVPRARYRLLPRDSNSDSGVRGGGCLALRSEGIAPQLPTRLPVSSLSLP
jgi:hypothetical protein